MEHSYSAGGVVVNSEGKVLVVAQRSADHEVSWSLPKGKIKAGEDIQAAAQREIKEESGISGLTFVRELGTYDRHQISADGLGEDAHVLKTITMNLYTTRQDALQPEDPDNPEAKWVAPEEVAALLTHPKDKAFFTAHLAEVQALK